MKVYWDSSALIEALTDREVGRRLRHEGGVTRTHSICEIFSILTGGRLRMRLDGNEVSEMIEQLCRELEVVDLSADEMLQAMAQAKKKGVRGGRVYDYIHATVAYTFSCERVYTLNLRDFEGLYDSLEIVEP